MRVAVAGGSGHVGSLTVRALRAAGHEAVVLGRSTGADAYTGAGLGSALEGCQAVVDCTSSPATDEAAAVDFFGTVSRNLLAAGHAQGVRHHVLLSVVGLRPPPLTAHYAGKLAQEAEVANGEVPWTVVRATQLHDFALMAASWTEVDGVATIAPLLVQPAAPADVAAVLAETATGEGARTTVEVAGPETQDLVDMARRSHAALGRTVRLVPTWDGIFDERMAGRVLLPGPDARVLPTTFQDWLDALAQQG